MDDGFLHHLPGAVVQQRGAGLVGHDARFAGRELDGFARAGVGEVLGGHHEREPVCVGMVDYDKRAVHAIGGGEFEERVAEFEPGAAASEASLRVGLGQVEGLRAVRRDGAAAGGGVGVYGWFVRYGGSCGGELARQACQLRTQGVHLAGTLLGQASHVVVGLLEGAVVALVQVGHLAARHIGHHSASHSQQGGQSAGQHEPSQLSGWPFGGAGRRRCDLFGGGGGHSVHFLDVELGVGTLGCVVVGPLDAVGLCGHPQGGGQQQEC